MIPFHIRILSMLIPIYKYDENNLATGEITRMSFRDAYKEPFGKQVVGTKDGFEWIWRHLGCNYWKVVGKYTESPWSCQ